MDTKDEFDDLSFPEVSFSLLVDLAGEEPAATPPDPTAPQQVEQEELDTGSEDGLWNDIEEITENDYLTLDLLEASPTPELNKQVDPSPAQLAPLALHFSQTSSSSDLEDIEDLGMNPSRNILSFMERFRRKKSLSVSNLVHPFW
jgi:hypothetical protein